MRHALAITTVLVSIGMFAGCSSVRGGAQDQDGDLVDELNATEHVPSAETMDRLVEAAPPELRSHVEWMRENVKTARNGDPVILDADDPHVHGAEARRYADNLDTQCGTAAPARSLPTVRRGQLPRSLPGMDL